MPYKEKDYGGVWLLLLFLFIIFMLLNACSTSKEVNEFQVPPEILGIEFDISDYKQRDDTKIVLYEIMVTPAVNIVQAHFYLRNDKEWIKQEAVDNLDMHGAEAQNFIKVTSWVSIEHYEGDVKFIFNAYGTHSHDTQEHIITL